MSDQNDSLPSLDVLQKKIDQAKSVDASPDGQTGRDMSNATRFITDLVAGVIVGVGVGYGVDYWLNTLPLCMIIGLFLGMAAGVRNMLRSAKIIDKQNS